MVREMKENVILQKAIALGVRIVKLAEFLENQKQKVIAGQILRSGTSIGANVAESEYASSKPDFINKLHIAQKEAGETGYWLQLLKFSGLIDDKMYASLKQDLEELLKMIGKSLITSKQIKT